MAKEFLHKHFINEAKAAINRWSGVGGSGGIAPAPGGLVEIDVFPERELIFWGGGDDIWTNSAESMFTLEEGQTYHVSIDGVVHSCVAKKNVYEYDSGYDSETWLGWSYDDDTGNTIYSHPFCISTHTSVVYEGTTYTDWCVGLQGSDDSGEPLPHTIRIYKECKADDMASISTEFTIPTQNHENGMILYEEPLRLDIGWTYTVRIMDQTYECRCDIEPDWGMLYLGNPLLAGATPNEDDDQYPFFMAKIELDGTRAIGVMIDPNTFPIGEDIHVTCHFKDIGEVKLERATIMESGMHYPSEGYDGFASVDVVSTKGGATPGLYLGGSRYNILVKPWDELITEGYIRVDSGTVYKGNNSLSDLINGIPIPDMSELPYDTLGGGEILFPNDGSVRAIGQYVFSGYDNLRAVAFGDYSQLENIGAQAFYQCEGLERVDFGNFSSLSDIEGQAFDGCSNLIGVNFGIGSKLVYIGYNAFSDCVNMPDISLPDSVESIGHTAFGYCDALKRILIPRGVTRIDTTLCFNCVGLTELYIPDTVTNIERSAFYGCTGLTHVELPANIGNLGSGLFVGCTALRSITVLAETPPLCTGTGDMFPSTITEIKVPSRSVDAYKSASVWSNYANIIVAI